MTTNIRLSDAIDEYKLHMQSRGAKPNTVKNHQQTLAKALVSWGNIYVASITAKHIDSLFAENEWSASTRNLYLGNLRGGFFAWCRRQGYMGKDFDPTDGWRNLKVGRRERKWIPVEDFNLLLDAASTPRDRAVIAIGLFTMCRGSEVSYLKVGDVDFDNNLIDIYREKTEEYDTMPMSSELHDELLTWFAVYRERMGVSRLPMDWFVVPASYGLPMAYDPLIGRLSPTGEPPKFRPTVRMRRPYVVVQRALVAMGIDPHGSGVHLLRRSAGRALFDRLRAEGYDGALKRVSSMLGHKSVSMTEHYLGLGIERQQRNDLISGKPLFPKMAETATVSRLREVSGHG